MDKIEIFEEIVKGKYNVDYKFSILRFTTHVEYSKSYLDEAVSIYVGNNLYNEFVEIYNSDHWFRIIISGINELNYNIDKDKNEIVEFDLHNNEENIAAKAVILRGGLYSETPLEYMTNFVTEYTQGEEHLHCVEIFMDNPWVRVVLFRMNIIVFKPFTDQRL
jgi:hypothetical protein